MTDIVLVNRSTVLTDAAIEKVIPALQAQVTEDWLPHWPNRGAMLHFAASGAEPPTGMWPIYILDHTDVPGAGGYHDDDSGTPEGKVFAADAMQYGEQWTVDCSHELLEMLGDPDTNTIISLPHGLHCLQEVGDAVEADEFGYLKQGVLVTDFVLPAYFNPPQQPVGVLYDFRGRLHKPAPALLSGGYLGIELPNGEWTQVVKRKADGTMSRRARNSHRVRRMCS